MVRKFFDKAVVNQCVYISAGQMRLVKAEHK
jgi:hypothetical protein